MRELVVSNVQELAARIAAAPDAADRVAALLVALTRINRGVVAFTEDPTRCALVEELAFAHGLAAEVGQRLAENDAVPLPRSPCDRMREAVAKAAPVIAVVHRACVFASTVWTAAGGEVPASAVVKIENLAAADVQPAGGRRPH